MSKDRAKIAMFISDINAGGTGALINLLVKNLDREKFQIIVVACGPGPVAEQIGKNGDEYHNLRTGSIPCLLKFKEGKLYENIFAWPRMIVWMLKSTWKLFLWLRKNKIDIIHSHLISYHLIAGLAGRMAGVPSIWHMHGPSNLSWRRGGPLLAGGYLDTWLATCFMAVSHFTASTFHPSWKKKTVVIWNAIDAKAVASNQRNGELRKMTNTSSEEKLIGVVAIIQPRKGLDRFIETAAKVAQKRNDVKFVIIGEIWHEMGKKILSDLSAMAEKSGIKEKVCFIRGLKNASYYMSDMDVFFMCSIPKTETFGLVVIEAMAAGVPAVAFANDAMPEIIEEGKTGFMVPDGDTTLAAERILRVLDNPQLAGKFKETARNRVYSNFDVPILVKKIEALYTEMLQ